jgi:hypothetical protein
VWYYFIRQRYIKISIFAKKKAENVILTAFFSPLPLEANAQSNAET